MEIQDGFLFDKQIDIFSKFIKRKNEAFHAILAL